MRKTDRTLVMKFGGASVATPEHFDRIAVIIYGQLLSYSKIVVVVSAMGNTTNQLIELAKEVNPNPPRRELDMLISVGERISISLLAMALAKIGCEAMSFTGSQTGIITSDEHSEAKVIDVRPQRLIDALKSGKIAIVAGFQGMSLSREITTLGRGGSDTTAVAIAIALNAEKVEFYKDVPGIFDLDPKIHPQAVLYSQISYEEAIKIALSGAKVLNSRALYLAEANAVLLHIKSFLKDSNDPGTLICDPVKSHPLTSIYEPGLLQYQ